METGSLAGCFYCEEIYSGFIVQEWTHEIDEENVTAICPKCGIDSVLSLTDLDEYKITKFNFSELLTKMNKYWF